MCETPACLGRGGQAHALPVADCCCPCTATFGADLDSQESHPESRESRRTPRTPFPLVASPFPAARLAQVRGRRRTPPPVAVRYRSPKPTARSGFAFPAPRRTSPPPRRGSVRALLPAAPAVWRGAGLAFWRMFPGLGLGWGRETHLSPRLIAVGVDLGRRADGVCQFPSCEPPPPTSLFPFGRESPFRGGGSASPPGEGSSDVTYPYGRRTSPTLPRVAPAISGSRSAVFTPARLRAPCLAAAVFLAPSWSCGNHSLNESACCESNFPL